MSRHGSRRLTSSLLAAGALGFSTLLLSASEVRAEFSKATLLSGTSQLQFSEANAPATAASGAYVAFQGTLAGVSGVYRRDLQTGEVQLVAGDAAAPSISANGSRIAFTTEEDLSPWREVGLSGSHAGEPPQDIGCPEVYVRNMERSPQEAGAYTLAAAVNGSGEGISFDTKGDFAGTEDARVACSESEDAGFPVAGAQAAPAAALSASGNEVVFTLLSESNLTGEGTPPSQVVVRNLETETTTLVTEEAASGSSKSKGQPVTGGGAYPDLHALEATPARGQTVGIKQSNYSYGTEPTASTAAISADGSTVAWLGTNVTAQVSTAEVERAPSLTGTQSDTEAEPLWRRLGEPSPTARRLLAGSGLDFFTQDPVEPPAAIEAGSLLGTQGPDFVPPALSANGDTVAVVATAPDPSAAASLVGRITGLSELNSDGYVVHVEGSSGSTPRITPLTEITSYDAQQDAIGDIGNMTVSPDGTRVAFDTSRTPLESPSLVVISPPSQQFVAGAYEANLELGTLQRVTSAYDEAEPNSGAELLSFFEDDTLVFSSRATNLFFGDGVSASEVYEAHELPQSSEIAPSQVSETPLLPLPVPAWTLSATATAERDGSVIVHADLPAAGRLDVEADAQLPAAYPKTMTRKTSSHSRKSAKPAKAASTLLRKRLVAHGLTDSVSAAEVTLRLNVADAYRSLVESGDGLYALLRVAFAAPGHQLLVREIPVTFRQVVRSHARGRQARKMAKREEQRKPGKQA